MGKEWQVRGGFGEDVVSGVRKHVSVMGFKKDVVNDVRRELFVVALEGGLSSHSRVPPALVLAGRERQRAKAPPRV